MALFLASEGGVLPPEVSSGTMRCMISSTPACARYSSLRILLMLTVAFALGIAHSDASARRQKTKHAVEATDLSKRIHTLINKERKRHRLTVLAWNDDLMRLAEKHSSDMDNKNYLDHNSPDGKGFRDRYRQSGFTCEVQVGNVIYIGAENIALSHLYNSMIKEKGNTYYNWNSPQEIALRTVRGWMNSPGHRKNILAPHWRQEGIGVKIEDSPGNKVYITQNFC